MTTNVPPVTFTPTGFQTPAAPLVLVGVQADITAAFGVALNYNLNTPQGQLSSSEAAVVFNVYSIFCYYSTQMDPAFATGRMQDGIGRIYFMERLPPLSTVLTVQCFGLASVIIPAGSLIQDPSQNIYASTDDATIGSNGNVTIPFATQIPGPVAIPGSVKIYQAITGWDSVTLVSGVVGRATESRAAFEARRAASVAANANGTVSAIRGILLNGVAGVLDAYVTENTLSSPLVVGGVTLAPKSVYVAVVGGLAQDVANAIWSKKPPGCGYNGSTTVTVFDTNSKYSPPLPSYQVSFQRPTNLPILFNILLTNNPLIPADAATQIQNAMINAFQGNVDNVPKAEIGSTIYAAYYGQVVSAVGAWAQLAGLTIGSPNAASASIVGRITGASLQVDTLVSGTLAVGLTLSDGSGYVNSGVRILSQVSGPAGGTGVYTVNGSLTVGASLVGSGTGVILNVVGGTGVIAAGEILSGGTGVPANTTILQQLTGTAGGIGTYQLSGVIHVPSPITLTADNFMLASPNTGTSVVVQINQEPTLDAPNIVVATT